jgi:methionine-S-sulfoxide reductase
MRQVICAGGCFWGVEAYFKQLAGITDSDVGYVDGGFKNPSYEQVCHGSGHAEAVLLRFDETVISFEKILDHYFNIVDPTLKNRQGPDIGMQYRSGFYNLDDDLKAILLNRLEAEQKNYDKPLQVEIRDNVHYDSAEGYHQDYLDKNPSGYCHINLTTYKDVL